MSDATSSGFGKFVPGFEFLQNLAGQAAGGVVQGLGQSLPQLPNLGHWVAPTFNVEDLEKRIEELKAVHFWLDQNAKALGATIQALEVQKMTLATLQNMNFSLGDVANALKIKAADTVANFTGVPPVAAPANTQFAGLEIPPRTYGSSTSAADEPPGEDEDADEPVPSPGARSRKSRPSRKPASAPPAAAPAGGVVDPLQWWGALSQQFQHIATNAMKDVAKQGALDTTRHVASGLTEQAVKTATGVAGKVTRGLTDTVARNVGMATGMGKAAARAVTGSKPAGATGVRSAARPAAPRPATAQTPARKPVARQAPPSKRAAEPAARSSTAQPLSTGDWPMPTAFFQVPGFPMGATPAAKAPARARGTAGKTPARKSAVKKTAPTRRR